MFLIFISLFTGYLGMVLGTAIRMETAIGVFGFLCPCLFLFQRLYIKIEKMEKKLDEE